MGRVLVVDDDPDMAALVELHLQRAGHIVQVANSPHDAIALAIGRETPDVVVLDVAMPEMNGFELLRELRRVEELSSLRAVFLSARVTALDIEAGRQMGAMYLTKPFVASALETIVERLVEDGAIALCARLEERIVDRHDSDRLVVTEEEHLVLERLTAGHNASLAMRAQAVLASATPRSGPRS